MRWRWLLVLPVAVALVVVASASRLHTVYWPGELRERTAGEQGEPVRVTDEWVDEDGTDRERELTVTLVDVRPATRVPGFSGSERVDPPDGTAVWEIVLGFEVDPDVPLGSCEVSLIDSRGRESDAVDTGSSSVGDVDLPWTGCTPPDTSGPGYDGTMIDGEAPRPPSYEVEVYAVTAASVEPERVRIWWEPPDFVELTLDP